MKHFCFQCHKNIELYTRLWLGSGSLGIGTRHTGDPREIPVCLYHLCTQLLHVNLQEIVQVVNRDVNSKKNLYLCYSS